MRVSRKVFDVIKESLIQIVYNEMHPLNHPYTANELEGREQKAVDEYLGKNCGAEEIVLPVLKMKVDQYVHGIVNKIESISI